MDRRENESLHYLNLNARAVLAQSAKTDAAASEKKKTMGGVKSFHTATPGDSADKRPEARVR